MPRKSQISMTSRADAAKTATVELARRNPALARRLAAGNVQGGGNRAIPLKEPERWQTYIANTYLNEDAFYQMKQRGWEPLTADDLSCDVQESGFRLAEDGRALVRGEKGREMVFKMPKEDYALLQDAKTRQNLRGIGSHSQVKHDLANAAAGQLGSEAADYINNLDGQVMDTITGGDAA